MEFQTKYLTPDIKLSVYGDKQYSTEVSFEHHMLVWFIAGETKIIRPEASYLFNAGDIFLIPANQVATVINYPKHNEAHKAVVMHLSKARLEDFYGKLDIQKKVMPAAKIHCFGHHPLLKSCLASLIPYFDLKDVLPEEIASLKITEALTILRTIDPSIDAVLANFEAPGKLDLAGFMEKNFMFNMPMQQFGRLTGRSLSTFNRDFKKQFHTTPQKWLTEKRLALAHYQIAEKKKKPAEIFFETGFEDLSHFSHAFKKYFGYTPSSLMTKGATNSK